MSRTIFSDDFLVQPLWWDDVPRGETTASDLPDSVDVLIVGSGFAGLNAGLVTARAGMKTLVLDRGAIGEGASTRLVGYIGRFLHYSIARLIEMFGEEQAVAMYREGGEAHFHFLDFVKSEGFDVGMLYRGRFSAAHTPQAYEALEENARNVSRYIPFRYEMCPRSRQREHIGTDIYHGGLILHEHGTVQPAKYHQCLVDAVRSAGAQVVGGNAVRHIRGRRGAFEVTTARGVIKTREVIACTNGYSNQERHALPYLRKRVIPVPGYQIATEPLAPELMKTVKPSGKAVYDSKINLNWDRPTPDDRAIVFGGRSGTLEGRPHDKAKQLYDIMTTTYPDLRGVRIRRYWQGFMGFGFDKLTHVGCNEHGIHYATSFSASGLPLGTYFGQKVGRRVADIGGGDTSFWNLRFPANPLFNGRPWFVPLLAAFYDFQDRFIGQGNKKTG